MMKKLFIGCGILVLLFVGVLGYGAYQLYPDYEVLQERWTMAIGQFEQLERTYPFEAEAQSQLDSPRFADVLDMRVEMAEYLRETVRSLDAAFGEDETGEDLGMIESFRMLLRATREPPIVFADHLATAAMGPTEFSWYTRVLWACLRRVDQGAGEAELGDLRGTFEDFETFYAGQRQQNNELPPLNEVIGSIPAAVVAQASIVLASDVERVRDGLSSLEFDYLYLLLPIQEMKELGMLIEQEGAAGR